MDNTNKINKFSLKENYNMTLKACYIGYITQAIVNTFIPLLFLTFQRECGISLDKIAMLVSFNFGVQLFIDYLASKYVDKIGYRASMVIAHICASIGLVGLGIFPDLFANHFYGLIFSIMLYAIGGGLIEVLISPIVEACPTDHKETTMSFLHSFYCWGHVSVILVSTLFFVTVGINNWRYLAFIWALVPFANIILFAKVPIPMLVEEGESLSIKQLIKMPVFWILVVLMICSGASEHGMGQWASALAESGLKVSKTVGDLLGPCFFAVMMGLSRVVYAKVGRTIDLKKFMIYSGFLCVISYLITTFSPVPLLALLGCGLCGFSVGIFWPGTFSIATETCPKGGTVMFAYLALAGDLGCGFGPTIVGRVAQSLGGDLKMGILAAIVFPIILIGGVWCICKKNIEDKYGE